MSFSESAIQPPTSRFVRKAVRPHRAARGERRVPFRVPCRVRLVDVESGEVRTIVGQTLNISAGGLSLQLSTDVPIGTWVETLVPHPDGKPLFLSGRVVHSRRSLSSDFEVGVASEAPATSL